MTEKEWLDNIIMVSFLLGFTLGGLATLILP